MRVLPIRFLTSYDKEIFGEELVNLAHLQRLGMPIKTGWVILPPTDVISKAKRVTSKSHLQLLKEEFKKNPQLEELFERVKDTKVTKKIWEDLVDKWFLVLEREIEVNEQPKFSNVELRPEPVYLTDPIKAYGVSYLDKKRGLVEVNIIEGELEPYQYEELEKVIKLCSSKLLMDYVFEWILEGGSLKIVKLKPFTQGFLNEPSKQIYSQKAIEDKLNRPTVFKVFKQNEFDQTGWVVVNTPKELVDIPNYEGKGSGFIVDFDRIYALLTGNEKGEIDKKVLKDFFVRPIKDVIGQNIPVLFRGKLVEHDDVLKFLIKIGVNGVILDENVHLTDDYIRQLEHLHLNGLLD